MSQQEWTDAAHRHGARVSRLVDAHVERRARHENDPVSDFLFEYYRFRMAHLRCWSPGTGVEVALPETWHTCGRGDHPDLLSWLDARGVVSSHWIPGSEGRIRLDTERIPAHRQDGFRFIRELLTRTLERKPLFGCAGMHEWAMVYGSGPVRHESVPLRLSRAEIDQVVQEVGPRCTHFDAFRFFAESARPLNAAPLTRGDMIDAEQPGCLHTGMDLYKWAYKGWPWIPSDLIVDGLELAFEIRELDMRASPYDLRAHGLEPVRVETPDGRAAYVAEQQAFYDRAQRLRRRLLAAWDGVLEAMPAAIGRKSM